MEEQFKIGDVVMYTCDNPKYSGLYLLGHPNDFSIGYDSAVLAYGINLKTCRLATSEERKQFMDELAHNGYQWDDKKKRFRIGGDYSVLCKGDKWIYIDDFLHKQEEPVSDDLLSVAKKYVDNHVYGNEDDKFTRSVHADMFCAGAQWQKKENIDNANKEYWRGYREGKQAVLDKYAELEKQKPACSEEDVEIIEALISLCDVAKDFIPQLSALKNWLKSLRPQNRWKPSEQEKTALRTAIRIMTKERSFPLLGAHLQNILDAFEGESRVDWKPSKGQMEALKEACNELYNPKGELYSLYEQLKAL